MNQLLNLLSSKPTLIVSLPKNSLELAEAAAQAGADMLKTHIHVHHDASGTHFGDLASERTELEQIIALGLPTAIVVGAGEEMATPEEMTEIKAMGFQGIDAYAHFLPSWMLVIPDIAKMVAVDSTYSIESVKKLDALGMDILEAAIVQHEGYGAPLSEDDIVRYRRLREAVMVPIVVPTQRKILPQDIPILFNSCHIDALMIGAIVTGDQADSIANSTKAFKKAIQDLSES